MVVTSVITRHHGGGGGGGAGGGGGGGGGGVDLSVPFQFHIGSRVSFVKPSSQHN